MDGEVGGVWRWVVCDSEVGGVMVRWVVCDDEGVVGGV